MIFDSSKEKEKFFSNVVELAADSILAIDEDMKILLFNREAEKTFGYSSDEIVGQHLNVLIPSCFHEQHNQHVCEFLKSPVTARLMNERANVEVEGLRRDGSTFFSEISIIKVQLVKRTILVAIIRDITKSKELQEKLVFLSEHDSLTGILNRRKIEENLQKEMERASRYDRPLSLLLIDIDHFKKINDTFGHDVGDLALKHLVSVLTNYLRKVDSLGRWGGEEFVILLPEVDEKGILVVAEKLRKAVEIHPLKTREQKKEVSFTVSLGGATHDASGISPEIFIKQADEALYQAKQEGRNRFCLYTGK